MFNYSEKIHCRVWLFYIPIIIISTISVYADEKPEPQEENKSSLWGEVLHLYEKAKEKGERVPTDVYEWIKEDLQSVGDWEYHVFDVEESGAESIQTKLNELGADRWECICVQTIDSKTRFILKRSRKSYLKHLPLSQLAKIIPGGGDSGSE